MEQYSMAGGGYVYHFDTGPFNWYLIAQSGRLTIVDAGFPGHYPILVKGINALGFQIKDIAAILLTHAHADHMGFAEKVRKATNAPVFVHRDDYKASQRRLQLPWFGLLSNAWHPYVMQMLSHAALNGIFTMPAIAKVTTIEDGQILDVPGKPHVIHAPGHTTGEVAFFLPESGILLSGDTLITRHLLTGTHGQPQVAPAILTYAYEAAYRSLDRIIDLGTVTLLPGHGKAWQGNMRDAVGEARQGQQA
ncbi:MAG: MBL fold metallo-hydrolase [Anaerolineae bacterium]